MKIFFPGSFDPFTIGHENLILRTINIFKNAISTNEKIEFDIAVAINPNKKGFFPVEERYEALKKWARLFPQFHPEICNMCKFNICTYDNLTYDYANKIKADFILRGVRNTIDFEYEKSIADFNKKFGKIETLFLMNDPSIIASSTIVRELLKNIKEEEAMSLFPKGYNILDMSEYYDTFE